MYWVMVMGVGGDIDWIRGLKSEAEMDVFAREESSYGELDPEMDNPDHWENYDPKITLVFEGDEDAVYENNKFVRPVAVYMRGQRFDAILSDPNGLIPPRREP